MHPMPFLYFFTQFTLKTIKNNWAPEGMIKFCESRLKEIDHVLERIPENALDKTTEKKYHELRIQLENKIHEQKERIKRGETSSIDNMGPSQLLEEMKKLGDKLGSFSN